MTEADPPQLFDGHDAGDGFGDHADWIEPRLTVDGVEKKLTELKWTKAATGWGGLELGQSAGGRPISVNGKRFTDAIGAHSLSVIEYDLLVGATRFTAFGALDDAAVGHTRGATTWVTTIVAGLVILNPIGLDILGQAITYRASNWMRELTRTVALCSAAALIAMTLIEYYVRGRMLRRRSVPSL